MNLRQLRDAIREELQEPIAGRWTDAQLNRYINDGLEELASYTSHRWRVELSVLKDEWLLDYPPELLNIRLAYWYQDGVYTPVAIGKGVYVKDYTTSGKPETMWIEGDKIKLFPTPSVAAKLILFGTLAPVKLEDDEIDVPCYKRSERVLISYGVWKALKSDKDPATAESRSEYMENLFRWLAIDTSSTPQDGVIEDVYLMEDIVRSGF